MLRCSGCYPFFLLTSPKMAETVDVDPFTWDDEELNNAAFITAGHIPPKQSKTPPPSNCGRPKTPPTPLRFTTASKTMSAHSKEEIHPFVLQDLKHSKHTPIDTFTKNVFGLHTRTRVQWCKEIAEQRWFEDPVIEQALADYCAAKSEKERYEPFVRFLNRVLELAPGNLSGIPKENPYPLGDVCFADHHNKFVAKIEEHYPLGATRSPDIVCVLREVAERIKDGGKAEWSDIATWFELKHLDILTGILAAERERRGLSPPPTPSKMTRSKKQEVCVHSCHVANILPTTLCSNDSPSLRSRTSRLLSGSQHHRYPLPTSRPLRLIHQINDLSRMS